MVEHPVLFNDEMMRAILAGLKTQTRRPIKPQPEPYAGGVHPKNKAKHPAPYIDAYCGEPKTAQNPRRMSDRWYWWTEDDRLGPEVGRCPFGIPGDTLWVRESWRVWSWGEDFDLGIETRDGKRHWIDKRSWEDEDRMYDWEERMWTQSSDDCKKGGMVYDENAESYAWPDGREWNPPTRWRPSIRMPRWASRLDLTVKRVWVERFDEISNADIVAEGIEGYENDSHGMRSEIFGQFMTRWDAIYYAKRGLGWDANPWVWACEWEVVEE